MKLIISLLCLTSLLLVSCTGDPAATTDKNPPQQETNHTPPPPKTESTESPPLVNTSPSKTESSPSSGTEKETGTTPVAINYLTLATAYCKCAEHTVSINNKLAKLMESGDNTAFEAMLPEADKAFKGAMECCRKAKSQQVTTAAIDQQKLFKPLKNACPDLPKQLMLKMVTEIK